MKSFDFSHPGMGTTMNTERKTMRKATGRSRRWRRERKPTSKMRPSWRHTRRQWQVTTGTCGKNAQPCSIFLSKSPLRKHVNIKPSLVAGKTKSREDASEEPDCWEEHFSKERRKKEEERTEEVLVDYAKQREAMVGLYGKKNVDSVYAMEAAVQLNFDKVCDKTSQSCGPASR